MIVDAKCRARAESWLGFRGGVWRSRGSEGVHRSNRLPNKQNLRRGLGTTRTSFNCLPASNHQRRPTRHGLAPQEIIGNSPPSSLTSSSLVAKQWRKRSQQNAFNLIRFSFESKVNRWCMRARTTTQVESHLRHATRPILGSHQVD